MGADSNRDTSSPASNELESVVDAFVSAYASDTLGHNIGRKYLPSRSVIIEVVELALELFYPGFYGRQDLHERNIRYHTGNLLSTIHEKLAHQIEQCICFDEEHERGEARTCAPKARRMASEFMTKLPRIREMLLDDVSAAYEGDPAATSAYEVIVSYPGLLAVSVYRVAHELYLMNIPLMPRIMSEWAHSRTGADIHPGATIGKSFFIDHATGVVIGETSHIGDRVKLYQGVTLGALSHPRDENGRVIRNTKRHPTVASGATLYANATVLGGTTVVGEDSIVGGSVFLTKSIPPRTRVALKAPELRVLSDTDPQNFADVLDFQI